MQLILATIQLVQVAQLIVGFIQEHFILIQMVSIRLHFLRQLPQLVQRKFMMARML